MTWSLPVNVWIERSGISIEYLRHLEKCGEMLGPRLCTIHNLHYYQRLMQDLRASIEAGTLAEAVAALREAYTQGAE